MKPHISDEFKMAMSDAEKVCHDTLVELLGLKSHEAHIGVDPAAPDFLAFSIGEIRNGEVLHSGRSNAVHFGGYAEIWRRDRTELQQAIMTLVAVTPLDDKCPEMADVCTFRIATNGISAIEKANIQGQADPLWCWHVTVKFDIVFEIGKRGTV